MVFVKSAYKLLTMKQFKITIPKPCHEDWNAMTPNQKGRFCTSCSKTVIDFTQKTEQEIQDYLTINHNKKLCGHFYKKQLDSIVIQIPSTTFQKQLSFQKLFCLSLLFSMGTTLFSCKTNNGKTQKIEKIEVIDSLKKITKKLDSLTVKEENNLLIEKPKIEYNQTDIIQGKPNLFTVVGDLEESIIENEECITIGEVPVAPKIDIRDSLPAVEIMGVYYYDEQVTESKEPYSFHLVENPPRFFDTKVASKKVLQREFEKKIKEFVVNKFNHNSTINLGLSKGKKRIIVKFTINNQGHIEDIKVRAPHPLLKKKVTEIFKEFPELIPAKQRDKTVSIHYSLPIIFVVE